MGGGRKYFLCHQGCGCVCLGTENGSTNPDLLDFEDWSYRYIQKLISDQIRAL